MSEMFYRAESFNQPLKWNVSNVTDMKRMFHRAESFNQPLNNWNVSNVTNMDRMFAEARSFNQPLNKWDVSMIPKTTTKLTLDQLSQIFDRAAITSTTIPFSLKL